MEKELRKKRKMGGEIGEEEEKMGEEGGRNWWGRGEKLAGK